MNVNKRHMAILLTWAVIVAHKTEFPMLSCHCPEVKAWTNLNLYLFMRSVKLHPCGSWEQEIHYIQSTCKYLNPSPKAKNWLDTNLRYMMMLEYQYYTISLMCHPGHGWGIGGRGIVRTHLNLQYLKMTITCKWFHSCFTP